MMAIATLETQQRNHAFPYRKVVAPPDPSVALSITFSDLVPDPAAVLTWQFTVLRTGDRTGAVSVGWAITVAGSPMPASTFVGGVYPSGTVALAAGVTSATGSFQTAAGGQPGTDQVATLALLNPSNCVLGSPVSASLRLPGKVIPAQDQVSVACPDTSWTVDDATHDHLVTVTRSNALGSYLAGSQVTLALTGTGSNPIVAADISGGLLNTSVVFAAGETSKPYTITVLAGTAPTADKTGRVAISAPVGCQLATATQVDVAIPKDDVIVITPTGVLPPQYTDPNFAGMSAYSTGSIATPITNRADLLAAAGALSNNVLCKTKFIELATTFNDTGTLALGSYKGYVSGGKIYPLIIRSVLANIGDRTKKNNLAHFRHITTNGSQWLWLYGLAAEFPLTADAVDYPFQGDSTPAILLDGSTDCIVTRCWLDAPQGVFSNTAVRPRIGANDFYGTVESGGDNWQTQLRLKQSGKFRTTQDRTIRAWMYQNFHGHVRHGHMVWKDAGDHSKGKKEAGTAAFYTGDGVEPDPPIDMPYPANPYDLNIRESWYFNNMILVNHTYCIYSKGALNIWRNRVVSIDLWTDDDVSPQGNAFHYIAVRGGNITGKPLLASYPQEVATVKYNSTEGAAGHSDLQGWNVDYEFNDWHNVQFNIFMHCDKLPKTLLGGTHVNFRSNKNGNYVIGNSRADGGYKYNAPVKDLNWENEGEGVAADAPTWKWATEAANYSPNGGAVSWSASGLNDVALKVTFPGDTQKTAAAVGQLSKKATTTAVRKLKTAYRDSDYTGEFTKAKKGIQAKDAGCLTWDYVGDGGGDGGDGGEPTGYELISENMTVWWLSDDMATDYPHTFVNFIAGGGFEVKAQNNPTDGSHACLNIWHKKRPPDGDCVFTFFFTLLDANDSGDAGSDGIFALFRPRQKGSDGFPADPNAWTKAQYRPVAPYQYTAPGSDLMVRDRTSGYRHSLANHATSAANSMQFRCRFSDGGNDGVDDSISLTPTVPATVPTDGSSFVFTKDVKYKLEYTRTGTTCTCVKTKVSDGATQTWTYVDAKLGPTGQGVGGWCGFHAFGGRWFKIEPVAGIPFCSAAA